MPVETVTNANVKKAVPFFGVTNMEASLRFYMDGLGFEMKKQWIPEDGESTWSMRMGESAGAGLNWAKQR